MSAADIPRAVLRLPRVSADLAGVRDGLASLAKGLRAGLSPGEAARQLESAAEVVTRLERHVLRAYRAHVEEEHRAMAGEEVRDAR